MTANAARPASPPDGYIQIQDLAAREWLPQDLVTSDGMIDLRVLVERARAASDASEAALADANGIAQGNLLSRVWNSGEFQRHVILAIAGMGELSKVNLALTAICNDLATENQALSRGLDQQQRGVSADAHATLQLTQLLLQRLDERSTALVRSDETPTPVGTTHVALQALEQRVDDAVVQTQRSLAGLDDRLGPIEKRTHDLGIRTDEINREVTNLVNRANLDKHCIADMRRALQTLSDESKTTLSSLRQTLDDVMRANLAQLHALDTHVTGKFAVERKDREALHALALKRTDRLADQQRKHLWIAVGGLLTLQGMTCVYLAAEMGLF
jgi:hypothetical protein